MSARGKNRRNSSYSHNSEPGNTRQSLPTRQNVSLFHLSLLLSPHVFVTYLVLMIFNKLRRLTALDQARLAFIDFMRTRARGSARSDSRFARVIDGFRLHMVHYLFEFRERESPFETATFCGTLDCCRTRMQTRRKL